jgi:hypothetical protein
MKTCLSCALHAIDDMNFDICTHPFAFPRLCFYQRMEQTSERRCGKDGKWWEKHNAEKDSD